MHVAAATMNAMQSHSPSLRTNHISQLFHHGLSYLAPPPSVLQLCSHNTCTGAGINNMDMLTFASPKSSYETRQRARTRMCHPRVSSFPLIKPAPMENLSYDIHLTNGRARTESSDEWVLGRAGFYKTFYHWFLPDSGC